MTAQTGAEQEAFQTLLHTHFDQLNEDSLQKVRLKAWDHFLELGLPGSKADVFKYVRLKNLFSQKYSVAFPTQLTKEAIEKHVLPECKGSVLVLVNGHYRPELSSTKGLPGKVAISHISAATRTFGTFLNNHWAKTMKEETDPFAVLNAALQRDGIFIYLPPKVILEQPIQIINMVDAQDLPMLINPRIQVFAGVQSAARFLTSNSCLSGKGFSVNMVVDFAIEEDAHVHYTQHNWDLPEDVWFLDATRASLKRNSTFKAISINSGSETLRQDYRMTLIGENCEALLNGVSLLSGHNETHTHILMDHQAPYCRSNQTFKNILQESGRASFEGKIMVRQAAQKTEAFQLNNNLLLSDGASAYSKPNLEIFADDVKASHGATVGKLDKEQMFYLQTRGFSHDAAQAILINGFCKEIVEMIKLPSMLEMINNRIEQFLAKQKS